MDDDPTEQPVSNVDKALLYLDALRARLSVEEFDAVAQALRATAAVLARGGEGVVDIDDSTWSEQLRQEYAALIMIVLTGRMDQRVVQFDSEDGSRSWAMVDSEVANDQDKPTGLTEGMRRLRQVRGTVQNEFESIVRASDMDNP